VTQGPLRCACSVVICRAVGRARGLESGWREGELDRN
jgi:hypothetical protein